MNLQQLASDISNNLHTITIQGNEDNKRIVWRNTAPEELREWFQDISGAYTGYTLSELDECYNVLDELCSLITEEPTDTDFDKLEELVYSKEWAYPSNADLLDWVRESVNRVDEVDECIQEGGTGIMSAIKAAMNRSRSDMAQSFLTKMQEKVEA